MDRQGRVKEEFSGSRSSSRSGSWFKGMASAVPQPMEGLHDSGPPPFLTKTYEIVEDSSTNDIVSWSRGNNSFVVWDPQAFSTSLLPKYFKHNNFSSFVRQLNTYGFRKVDPDRWEFAHEGFLRGQKHLLKNIRRRRTTQQGGGQASNSLDPDACVEVGSFGLDGEVDRLRRDKQVLMMELVKLRQQQQNTKACLQLMVQRLIRTEAKQQHMKSFLARAMQNPTFMQQLVQQKDLRKELEEAITKKRRRPIGQGPSHDIDVEVVEDQDEAFIKVEPQQLGDHFSEFQLALDMQGIGESQDISFDKEEEGGDYGNKGKYSDQGFWEDLLNNEDIGEEMGMLGGEVEDEENVNVLVQQLGYLSSSPK